jgi:hypothetical protein
LQARCQELVLHPLLVPVLLLYLLQARCQELEPHHLLVPVLLLYLLQARCQELELHHLLVPVLLLYLLQARCQELEPHHLLVPVLLLLVLLNLEPLLHLEPPAASTLAAPIAQILLPTRLATGLAALGSLLYWPW